MPIGLLPAALFAGYGVLCLVPLILAAFQGLPTRNIIRELSSGLVVVGYVMMLLHFVLSARFDWLSGRVGVDRVVPITIRGTRSILRAGQWLPRRGPIHVHIGSAYLADGDDFDAAVRLRDVVRAAILARCGEPDLARERISLV